MKLFIVACLKDNQEDVQQLLSQAKISIFSITDVIGFKQNDAINLLENWFASGDEKFDSVFVFSFTSSENVENCIQLIEAFNANAQSQFPIRAFVVPVEKSI
jgi:nitrogen regulatory protein PII